MAPEHAIEIERRGTELFGYTFNLGGGHEQEHRARVDEAADQPWTGDAVHLWPSPGDPDRAPLTVQRRNPAELQQRQPGLCPALNPLFEHISIDAGVT